MDYKKKTKEELHQELYLATSQRSCAEYGEKSARKALETEQHDHNVTKAKLQQTEKILQDLMSMSIRNARFGH